MTQSSQSQRLKLAEVRCSTVEDHILAGKRRVFDCLPGGGQKKQSSHVIPKARQYVPHLEHIVSPTLATKATSPSLHSWFYETSRHLSLNPALNHLQTQL